MDLSTLLSNGPIFALIGVLTTVIINFLIQKSKSSVDIHTVERRALSEDQENFKKSILEELHQCRLIIDRMSVENKVWQDKALVIQEQKLALTEEIIRLNQKIIQLEVTIKELREILEKMKGENR